MSGPDWELKYLESVSLEFLEFCSMYEQMVKDACRILLLNFEHSTNGSYNVAKIHHEMTEDEIRQEYNAEWKFSSSNNKDTANN